MAVKEVMHCCGCGKPVPDHGRRFPLCQQCDNDKNGPTGVCSYRVGLGINNRCDCAVSDGQLGLCIEHSKQAWEFLRKAAKSSVPTCRRGHRVQGANIRNKSRNGRSYVRCKACLKAGEYIARGEFPDMSIEEVADRFYSELMGAAA